MSQPLAAAITKLNLVEGTGAYDFANLVTQWDVNHLLDYFATSVVSNKSGNNDEQIAIVRAEINFRCE